MIKEAMKRHGIPREEWEQRFKVRLAEKAALTSDELPAVFDAELSSWPEKPDELYTGEEWLTELPEAAADDNLSYWTDG